MRDVTSPDLLFQKFTLAVVWWRMGSNEARVEAKICKKILQQHTQEMMA